MPGSEEMARITRQVVSGQAAPAHETPEAREYRDQTQQWLERMRRDAEQGAEDEADQDGRDAHGERVAGAVEVGAVGRADGDGDGLARDEAPVPDLDGRVRVALPRRREDGRLVDVDGLAVVPDGEHAVLPLGLDGLDGLVRAALAEADDLVVRVDEELVDELVQRISLALATVS